MIRILIGFEIENYKYLKGKNSKENILGITFSQVLQAHYLNVEIHTRFSN